VLAKSGAVRELAPAEAYAVFRTTRDALLAPFEEIFEELLVAGAGTKIALQSVRASRLDLALQTGINGMVRALPKSGKVAGNTQVDAELASVCTVFAEWMQAKTAIEEEKIPEGFFELLVHSFTDPSVQGKAAIGATVGSIVPGVGTVLGGIVGSFFGGQDSAKRHSSLFERFHAAADHLREVLIGTHPSLLEKFAADSGLVLGRPAAAFHAGLLELDTAVSLIDAELEREVPSLVECERRARRCAELLPEESGCHALLGMVLQKTGQIDAAIEAVRVAVDTDPQRLANWTQMVGLLMEADRKDEVSNWLAKVAEYWPEIPEAQRCLAEGYLSVGRPDLAHTWAERALTTARNDIALMLLYARSVARLNRLDYAAELLMRVVPVALSSVEEWRTMLAEPDIASAARVAPAAGVLSQPLDHGRLAESCLRNLQRTDAYLGHTAPAVKIKAARETFLRGVPLTEPLLWYYDSTIFGSGSDGVALTQHQMAWTGLTETPETVAFREIKAVEFAEEYVLILRSGAGDRTCFCADQEMAQALFRFLTLVRAVEPVET
jgi:tetratricopeptide (TPR) repeat protein